MNMTNQNQTSPAGATSRAALSDLPALVFPRDLQQVFAVTRRTIRVYVATNQLPRHDVILTPTRKGWKRDTLIAYFQHRTFPGLSALDNRRKMAPGSRH